MGKLFRKTNLIFCILLLLVNCKNNNKVISRSDIDSINLKRGAIVQCGPADQQFGSVNFETSCPQIIKKDFNLAMALLHSFEYDEAEKMFAKIIDAEPGCAMAYWGVAMSNFHPLWAPATPAELVKGSKAIALARSLGRSSERESDYIEAIAKYFQDGDRLDHHTRCIRYESAMEIIYKKYPDDKEASIFYALALDAAADPADTSFAKQIKAGKILNAVYPGEPNHPGIIHYIIHTYDYPGLAELALPAARRYASVAPASAHAEHMPSHIFTRLGLWDESIRSNLASAASAKCYAENSAIKGHWDEELHAMDYLMYAYLQKADDSLAKAEWDYLKTIKVVYPLDFKVAYAYAAIPCRYVLENKMWKDAAQLETYPADFPWNKFPWQHAMIHFTRALGDAHIGRIDSARNELHILNTLHDMLANEKDMYKTMEVAIQIKAAEAWILFQEGSRDKALTLMLAAADMEDATQKHPVTPGELIPARELLGDMLFQMGKTDKAFNAYQYDLKIHPNRFNGLLGAGLAAEKSGNKKQAAYYYRLLSAVSSTQSNRSDLVTARYFLKKN